MYVKENFVGNIVLSDLKSYLEKVCQFSNTLSETRCINQHRIEIANYRDSKR